MAARMLRQTVQFLHIAVFRERFDQERTSAPKLSGASEFRATRLGSRLSIYTAEDRGVATRLGCGDDCRLPSVFELSAAALHHHSMLCLCWHRSAGFRQLRIQIVDFY